MLGFQAFQRGFIRRNRPRDDEARLKSLEEKPSVPAGGAAVPAGGVNCSLYAAMELSSSIYVLGNLLRLVRNESSGSPWSFSAPSSEDLAWISNQVDPIFHDFSRGPYLQLRIAVEKPRLQRLVLKLRPYQLHATWRKGTGNAFADALSRYPVQEPTPEDKHGQDPAVSNLSIRACLRDESNSLRMHKLHEAALANTMYLVQTVLTGFPASKHTLPPDLRAFWNGREHLSVDNGLIMRGERLVVPRSLRHSVLQDLHAAHQGLTRTKRRARQTVFWPHLKNDLDNLIWSCPQCACTPPPNPRSLSWWRIGPHIPVSERQRRLVLVSGTAVPGLS